MSLNLRQVVLHALRTAPALAGVRVVPTRIDPEHLPSLPVLSVASARQTDQQLSDDFWFNRTGQVLVEIVAELQHSDAEPVDTLLESVIAAVLSDPDLRNGANRVQSIDTVVADYTAWSVGEIDVARVSVTFSALWQEHYPAQYDEIGTMRHVALTTAPTALTSVVDADTAQVTPLPPVQNLDDEQITRQEQP